MEEMSTTGKKQLLLIDTDAGLDDAQAILMALAAPDVEVLALTTVSGNASAKQVSRNLLRLLKVAGRLDIPIFTGCEKMLVGLEKRPDSGYHGKDGFGDVPDPNPPDENLLQQKHAVLAALDITKKFSGQVTLVALGPLTNVAMAVRLDPEFGTRLKDCYIMGGNYRGEGNISTSAEFNFYCDPEAASVVLSDLGCPITLACWELCLDHSFPLQVYEKLRGFNTEKCQFLKELEKLTMAECKDSNWPRYITCDEIAMACAIDASVIDKTEHKYVAVERHGQLTRGQLVVDRQASLGKKPNARLVTQLHIDCYRTWLLKAIDVTEMS